MRYPRHFNIGPVDSPEGICELVKWCQGRIYASAK